FASSSTPLASNSTPFASSSTPFASNSAIQHFVQAIRQNEPIQSVNLRQCNSKKKQGGSSPSLHRRDKKPASVEQTKMLAMTSLRNNVR
ncbi:hypothetical protein ACMWP9_33205, partial [Escherichia coli]